MKYVFLFSFFYFQNMYISTFCGKMFMVRIQGGIGMDFKQIIDAAVNSVRFRIDECIDFEDCLEPVQSHEYNIIKHKLSVKEFIAFRRSLIRNSFLIEPVNNTVTSTKVEAHWSRRLKGDVR